jgi:DNA polymerase-3 subunit epsilon
MLENILIIDTETTGLLPEKGDRVIEVAAVLFNIKHKAILQCFSTLLPCRENPVEKINHISVGMTNCKYPFAQSTKILYENSTHYIDESVIIYEDKIMMENILTEMSDHSDALVAHNAQFDKKFIATLLCGEHLLDKKWICTKANFTWPEPLQRLRLEDICNAMKVPYINAHRAMSDCLLLAQCFQNVVDLEERINRC